MHKEIEHAPSPDSAATLSAILDLLVTEREERSRSRPVREQSVSDRARDVLTRR